MSTFGMGATVINLVVVRIYDGLTMDPERIMLMLYLSNVGKLICCEKILFVWHICTLHLK